MPIWRVRRSEAVASGVDVPAVKLSVSLLSSWVTSGLAGRTSHELEGHGNALLIVRHVCGISWGIRFEWRRWWWWSGGGLLCLLVAYSRGRRRRSKPEPRARAKPSLLASCDSNSQDGRIAIPLNPQIRLSASPLTHNAVHSCLQHAQAARHARLPRPAAREEPAPPGHSQDEVSRSCQYPAVSMI